MPDAVIQELALEVTWWIKAASKSISLQEDVLLDLCRRIMEMALKADTGITRDGKPIDRPVTVAINHPIGHVTQALINLWFERKPSDNDLLPTEIRPFFTALCDVKVDRYRHGRVLLAAQLIALFRVDPQWTEQYLLPLFSWINSAEAKGVWEGFLWSPRLYQPLLTAFKQQLLETARHYADLGEHRQQFVTFLTYAALGPTEGFTVEELRTAFSALPIDGLEKSVHALSQALEGAADQREEYWKNRVHPFWKQVWPKSRDLATPRIAESLIRLIIAANDEFPAALAEVHEWLRPIEPIEHPHFAVHQLHESGLCRRYPKDALSLLSAVIVSQPSVPMQLRPCLIEIGETAPPLVDDVEYRRLHDYLRKHGIL